MIQSLKMLNRSSLISFGFSFMLLFSFKADAESMIPDFSARYIFETDQFDFEGIRQLKTFADKRVFSFEDRARLIKAEFYSEFIEQMKSNQSLTMLILDLLSFVDLQNLTLIGRPKN